MAKNLKRTRRARRQTGGRQVVIPINGVDYHGADVFVINNYKGKESLVLFESALARFPGSFDLPGGRCENTHATVNDTASEELFEESRKAIYIAPHIFKEMDRVGSFVDFRGEEPKPGTTMLAGERRVYICKVPNISTTIYENNKAIQDRYAPRAFNETKSMIRIPLTTLDSQIPDMSAADITRGQLIDIGGAGTAAGTVATLGAGTVATAGTNTIYLRPGVLKAFVEARRKGLLARPFRVHDMYRGEEKTDAYY